MNMGFIDILGWVVALLAVYIAYVVYISSQATKLAKKLYGPEARLVDGNDHMWRLDTQNNPMIINSYYLLEGNVSAAEVAAAYKKEVLCNPSFHRLKQRLVVVRGLPFWVDDPEFDVRNHIADINPHDVPKDQAGLLKTMALAYNVPFPYDRAMWKMDVGQGYNGGTQTVIVNRMHHVLGDGMANVSLLLHLLKQVSGPGDKENLDSSAKAIMRKTLPASPLWTMLRIALEGPVMALRILVNKADCNPAHGYELSGRRRVAVSKQYDLADVKAMARFFGSTFNSTLFGILGSSFNRYFSQHGHVAKVLTLCIPVNLRVSRRNIVMENKFSPSFVVLPVESPDPEVSIGRASGMFDSLKSSVNPMVMYLLGSLMGSRFAPQWLGFGVMQFVASKSTAIITSVPGPAQRMLMADHLLESCMFWVPGLGNIGMGVSIMTYGGKLQVGVTADELCMKDPAVFVEMIDDLFAETQDLAAKSRTDAQTPTAGGSN